MPFAEKGHLKKEHCKLVNIQIADATPQRASGYSQMVQMATEQNQGP